MQDYGASQTIDLTDITHEQTDNRSQSLFEDEVSTATCTWIIIFHVSSREFFLAITPGRTQRQCNVLFWLMTLCRPRHDGLVSTAVFTEVALPLCSNSTGQMFLYFFNRTIYQTAILYIVQ